MTGIDNNLPLHQGNLPPIDLVAERMILLRFGTERVDFIYIAVSFISRLYLIVITSIS
jgi:hypothetical protein